MVRFQGIEGLLISMCFDGCCGLFCMRIFSVLHRPEAQASCFWLRIFGPMKVAIPPIPAGLLCLLFLLVAAFSAHSFCARSRRLTSGSKSPGGGFWISDRCLDIFDFMKSRIPCIGLRNSAPLLCPDLSNGAGGRLVAPALKNIR